MSYKTILVHIDPGRRCAPRVEVAARLALQHEAHLVALYVQTPFVLPGYLVHMGPELIETQQKAATEEMAHAEATFKQQLSILGFKNAEWRTTTDFPVDAVAKQARYADLVVIGQSDISDNSGTPVDFPPRLVLASGRPVLIIPYAGSFLSIGSRALIAWNGSHEATRAVTDAIPLLKRAQKVTLMAIQLKQGGHGSIPVDEIVLYLERHGVRVDMTTDPVTGIDVGNEILSRAADLSADLIVMGGYGHSRLREWVLGGATRTLLDSMTVPVLMSH
ncbi:universal stress protein [Geopsychrobacter electrodiphilus]|uniref:universal stress protein n=1 Tax=Geopsychrobacter electrodiphilus TaxID=225196 RepID=UPI00037FF60D|nr:universal stress protein [Geopsychrobacter electrodiphilus]